MQGLNKCLPKELHLPTNPHDIVEKFSCDSNNEACMNSKCNICKLPEKLPKSGGFETADINIEEWKLVDRRAQKVSVSINVQEVSSRFNTHVQILKGHIHVKRIQHTAFNNVKANPKEKKEILIQVDYSENYTNKDQGQIQSAYFGQKSFSIFTACCYVKIDGVIINENVTVTSEANDQSRSAGMSCWRKVLAHIRDKYRLEDSLILHLWSDACSGQFRSRFVFFLLSRFELDHTIFWYYNERQHGKGPMDGVGGIIKHRVFRDVKSGKVAIKNAEHFVEYADTILSGITSLYIQIDEVLEEPEDIDTLSPKINGTLEVHKIFRSFSVDGVCKMEFFYTAADEQPIHVQYYKKDGDPDVCGHAELPLSYNPDQICAECHGIYVINEEWLECNLCDQWFHEECFFF